MIIGLNQEEAVLIPVSIGNPLCDLYPVAGSFQLSCGGGMRGMGNQAIEPLLRPPGESGQCRYVHAPWRPEGYPASPESML